MPGRILSLVFLSLFVSLGSSSYAFESGQTLCISRGELSVMPKNSSLSTGALAEYVHRMRKYAKTMTIGDAVDRAIEECIQDGILKEFLEQNRAEAKAMSIFEYNQEEHIRMEREEALPEMGRHSDRDHPERQGSTGFKGSGKHL